MAVIDFSKWNSMPWWNRNGYKTREEAWQNYVSQSRAYCVLTAEQLREQDARVREINAASRAKEQN